MFDRQLSVEYAKAWAYGHNPRYYDFSELGGNCTNFVSQCLHAGGIPMNYNENGWFYQSLERRAPAWTGVTEFWNFGTSNVEAGLKLLPCALNELEIADIVQLGNGFRFYHNLIVTEVKEDVFGKRILVSAHDRNVFNEPLSSYAFVTYRCAKTGM